MGLGWQHLTGDEGVPYLTERESFREVLLKRRLRDALRRINPAETGEPWLDDAHVESAIGDLERLGSTRPMEANQTATDLLLKGTVVEGDPALHGDRDQTVRFIDFDRPERNDFLVVDQFRVEAPGGRPPIIPDVVLFVNGIPLVVVECKSPYIAEPMREGIDQLLRYSNNRPWVEEAEGVEKLFHYNQLLVSTYFHEAKSGTIGASFEHYLEWKSTSPVPESDVARSLGVETLSSQQSLAAGMLRPQSLLSIVHNFVLFSVSGRKTIKIVPRYQQFRAVNEAVHRLGVGHTRLQHGSEDQRGGIVWHTQGSGKSLTMVFLIRFMRTLPALRRFKILIVTDRTDLEEQLRETAALIGEPLARPPNAEALKSKLREEGAGLVFAMIQKVQEHDDEQYPELNKSEDVLLLVDEAHRSHSNTLHANLRRALPNAARIGFTGTPIMAADKTPTSEIFGPFIDRYTLQQSEADGATVPILYEGRTADVAIADGRSLDDLFEDMFRERTPEERSALQRKYATRGDVLEAEKLIAAKARDMLRHYVADVLPNGFKAQLVAHSRLAAVRYQAALAEAHRELLADLEALDPALLGMPEEDLPDDHTRYLVRTRAHLEDIHRLEFAAVISGANDDPPSWNEWTAEAARTANVSRFKKPLTDEDSEKQDGLAFLCVKSMLLTGFDAPVEQILYLDRAMQGHELLQAIARVNRTAPGKTHGLVVDYYGVVRHLEKALEDYDAADIHGAMTSLTDELPRLDDRHRRALAVFADSGLDPSGDAEACVNLLADVEVRADFAAKLDLFLESLDAVLPRPEALPYVRDAKLLGYVNKAAANLYRDSQLELFGAGHKVRKLIDDHLEARGVNPRVPPISITDPAFGQAVDSRATDRAKASEMEHAARYHIRRHFHEDPAYYRKLSERLDGILVSLSGNWPDLVEELRSFTDEIRQGRTADDTGLDPHIQAPFLGVIVEDPGGEVGQPSRDRLAELARRTVELVDLIQNKTCTVDFWRSAYRQQALRGDVAQFLDDNDLVSFERQSAVADEVVELARHLHAKLCP